MKKCVWGALVLVSLALPSLVSAQPQGPGPGMPQGPDTSKVTRKWLDVSYASASAAEKLDIYLPESGSGPFPVIVAIHGGGFAMGDRKDGQLTAMLAGLKDGYAVVSVDYRLSSEAPFPAAIQDLKAAVRYLRAHAAEYKLDPQRFAAWGGSAGGNLAALLGTSAGNASLEGTLGNQEQSSAVQAAVDWFGPIQFSTMDAEFKALGQTPLMGSTSSPGSAESRYLGKTIGTPEAAALVKAASPQTYVSPKSPPFFIEHGTADRNIPLTQSKNFAAALTQAIGADNVVFKTIPGAGHGTPEFSADANVALVLAFLDQHLK